ncbi:MAG: hypothetical protein RL120_01855, partial [Gammaproteobacteria bacterium]
QREQLEWQVMNNQTRQTVDPAGRQIFAVEVSGDLPIIGTIARPQGGYLVYRLNSIEAGSLDNFNVAQQRQLRQQLSGQVASAEFNAYTATLRSNADIDLAIDYTN